MLVSFKFVTRVRSQRNKMDIRTYVRRLTHEYILINMFINYGKNMSQLGRVGSLSSVYNIAQVFAIRNDNLDTKQSKVISRANHDLRKAMARAGIA